jgi:hypothetical protein
VTNVIWVGRVGGGEEFDRSDGLGEGGPTDLGRGNIPKGMLTRTRVFPPVLRLCPFPVHLWQENLENGP